MLKPGLLNRVVKKIFSNTHEEAPPEPSRPQRTAITFRLPLALADRLRNYVFFHKDETLESFFTYILTEKVNSVEALEVRDKKGRIVKAAGAKYPNRPCNQKTGRSLPLRKRAKAKK